MTEKLQIRDLLRENIRNIKPYSSARSEFTGAADIFLDANENYRDFVDASHPRNRYPDPNQTKLKAQVAALFAVDPDMLFLGNGSDEAIDLLYRAFARPGIDRAVIFPPTYGVYQVFADLNDIATIGVQLDEDFHIDEAELGLRLAGEEPTRVKLLWICSPNNPTGNAIAPDVVARIAGLFPGIVVVDEAYQDFSSTPSAISLLPGYRNLVVLRTFSKAWGLANARFGLAIADPEIAAVLKSIKYPYNLSGQTQETAAAAIATEKAVREGIGRIVTMREELVEKLGSIPYVQRVYPSDANFILVKVHDADRLYQRLRSDGIIIRNRTTQPGCANCVRITVGSAEENRALLETMERYGGEL